MRHSQSPWQSRDNDKPDGGLLSVSQALFISAIMTIQGNLEIICQSSFFHIFAPWSNMLYSVYTTKRVEKKVLWIICGDVQITEHRYNQADQT